MKNVIKYAAAVLCAVLSLTAPGTLHAGEIQSSTAEVQESEVQEADAPAEASPVAITDCTITLSRTVYTYTGKEKRPGVTVTLDSKKLKKNKDYEVSYADNTEIGCATVTITGINEYTASVTLSYTIFPKTSSSVAASVDARRIIVTWKKAAGADGYVLYRRTKGTTDWTELKRFSAGQKKKYTDTDCSCGETYEYAVRAYTVTSSGTLFSEYSKTASCVFRPAATEITQFMTISRESCSLRWNLVDEADGYIVYQKVDGKWKKVKTIAASETNHCTITKLTYKKTYTFAVRAYWKASDGSIVRGTLSASYKEKLSYKKSYENGYLLYRDASGDLITDTEGILGPQEHYSLQVNRTTNTVTVYAYDAKTKSYCIPVKAFLCSTGKATPAGTFYTSSTYRWHPLIHNVYGQWCTRITGSILFHSVYYGTNNNANSLDVAEFNKLGTAASAGCVRLNCADVKWIYDNCAAKTEVIIYDSEDPGPFGYPEQLLLSPEHTWDPTDPEMKELCKQNGCHQE